MRLVQIIVIVVGLGLATFAALTAKNYNADLKRSIAEQSKSPEGTAPVSTVIGLKRSVQFGEQLNPEDLKEIKMATAFMPAGTFAKIENVFPLGENVLRIVQRPMDVNEPLLASKVTEPGAPGGIRSALSAGMSAFTIPVNQISSVSGFLRPNDRVSIFWTGSVNGIEETRLIREQVRIIAVDQNTDPDAEPSGIPRTITVEGPPEEVAFFTQAQNTGRLQISLDSTMRATSSGSGNVSVSTTVFSGKKAPEPVEIAPVEEKCYTTIRKGASREDVEIPCG